MAVGKSIHKDSYARSIQITLSATVESEQIAYIDGWLGVTYDNGNSGDEIALDVEPQLLQVEVPAAFAPAVGAIIYLDSAQVTGHTPDDGAYGTSSGAGKIPFMKCLAEKDANNVIIAMMLSPQG